MTRLEAEFCLYFQEDLKAFPLQCPNPSKLEITALKVKISNKDLIVVCVYRPPSSSVSWWDHLTATVVTTTLPLDLSDHFLIKADFLSYKIAPYRRTVTRRAFKKRNQRLLREEVQSCPSITNPTASTDIHSIVTDSDWNPPLCPYGPYPEASFTSFKPVNQLDVVHILSHLDSAKASGPDGLDIPIIKMLAPELSQGLPTIFNNMLHEGLLPKQFKLAHVTPVYKRGNPTSPDNYRPISLLPVISKVLERIVFSQLTNFMESNPDLIAVVVFRKAAS